MSRHRSILIILLFFVSQTAFKQVFAEGHVVNSPADRAEAGVVRALTLDQCIAYALEHNPGLQGEREKIIELENDYRIAASALYPKVTVSANYQRVDDERIGVLPGMAYSEEVLAQAKVKQVLFDGGKTWYSRRAAGKAEEAQKESAEASRLDTVLAVSQAYYRVLEARELLSVGETSRQQREGFFKLTDAFYRTGRASRLEWLRAEAQLYDADRSLSQAREAYRLSELILKKIIGMDLRENVEITNSLPKEFPEPPGEEDLREEVLAGNPDLKKIGLLREQSEAALSSSRGPYWPELSLQGTYGYRDRDITAWDTEWTAGVFLEWSLFEGGLTRAQVGKARSKVNQVAWNEKAVRDQVLVDLREVLGNLRTALAAVKSSKRLAEAQDEAYKAAMAFYKQGKSTYLEVLSAQVELTQARASYVRAAGDYQNASAKLDRVVGKRNSYETEKRGNGETETLKQGGKT